MKTFLVIIVLLLVAEIAWAGCQFVTIINNGVPQMCTICNHGATTTIMCN